MDATTNIRPVSILCGTGSHRYCLSSVNSTCECSCHFAHEIPTNRRKLASLGIQLWYLRGHFEILTPEERRETVLSIVRNAEATVDFKGFTAEEVAERFEPTIAREAWSMRETHEDFGLDGYTGERLAA